MRQARRNESAKNINEEILKRRKAREAEAQARKPTAEIQDQGNEYLIMGNMELDGEYRGKDGRARNGRWLHGLL